MLQAMMVLFLAIRVASLDNYYDDVDVKMNIRRLTEQMNALNNVYLNNLEPKLSLISTNLVAVESAVQNLRDRSHVWDTVQLYIASWNEHMSTTDRKLDIISEGQQKFLAMDTKINSLSTAKLEYKVDGIADKLRHLEDELLKSRRDSFFGEFTTRGIISSIKLIEDRLASQGNCKHLETIIDDMSTKLDKVLVCPENDDSELLERLDRVEALLRSAPVKQQVPKLCQDGGTSMNCLERDGVVWTVVQRRGPMDVQQNFNRSWDEYKGGFGDNEGEFWLGNRALHELSSANELELRVELEDFAGNSAWARYESFAVDSEEERFALHVEGYAGNATDSLSSHDGLPFSTYDRKNDRAPDCCPCAVSYGSGWWFNSCFEANLNGIYRTDPHSIDYYQGIIWEKWLGNYSLKRALMMVRRRVEDDRNVERVKDVTTTEDDSDVTTVEIPYYEDP